MHEELDTHHKSLGTHKQSNAYKCILSPFSFRGAMPRSVLSTVRVVGHGMTPLGKLGAPSSTLMQRALDRALLSAGLGVKDLDGLIAVPSLADPHFMEAHYLATQMGILPGSTDRSAVTVRTIDTGGAGPVSGLLDAARMVRSGYNAVAVVAGDAVASLDSAEFLRRADATCQPPDRSLPSPAIPTGYDRVAQWQMQTGRVSREQLAMCSALMSRQASRHPLALTREPHTLAQILAAPSVAPATGLLECARRADGGAAIIVASSDFMDTRLGHDRVSSLSGVAAAALGPFAASGGVVVLGGGEASGPLWQCGPVIDEAMFSCEQAASAAFSEAQLRPSDIDWFGLYDCFPICFVRAVEACGLADRGEGGRWVEDKYHLTSNEAYSPADFPVNTHGGLMGFGAPWEVPAMYSIIEACEQLAGNAAERQVPGARRALVYGNGGIFSHSAVGILASPVD